MCCINDLTSSYPYLPPFDHSIFSKSKPILYFTVYRNVYCFPAHYRSSYPSYLPLCSTSPDLYLNLPLSLPILFAVVVVVVLCRVFPVVGVGVVGSSLSFQMLQVFVFSDVGCSGVVCLVFLVSLLPFCSS
ncbi:hypothetical protein VKT23_018368 [Stygiomarasmius scandens]|uniref:Transmembrane protein n=1 Tax=Marasmiellus scandens TaxID=2682957 RepID=A0ABR1IPR6_9AGAR